MSDDNKAVIIYGMLIGEAMMAREKGLFRGMTLGQIVNMFLIEVTGN